jgi:hypothetical protein
VVKASIGLRTSDARGSAVAVREKTKRRPSLSAGAAGAFLRVQRDPAGDQATESQSAATAPSCAPTRAKTQRAKPSPPAASAASGAAKPATRAFSNAAPYTSA